MQNIGFQINTILQPLAVGFVFLLTYLAEHLFPQRKELLQNNHDLKNIMVGVVNLLFSFASGYYLQKLMVYASGQNFGLIPFAKIPTLLSLVLQIICIDLFVYWWHRVNHHIPLFWKFHKFHHEDENMNTTTAVRFHTVELFFAVIAKAVFLTLMGITVTGLIAYGILFFPVVLLVHSNIRINQKTDFLLRKIIISPLMHRIHHSNVIVETNSNYGSVFPFWDRIFKSYRKKPIGRIKFGL
ncbi:sterol desaturase family protein [Mucilaginibacter sp. RB4R14]|uniref:sterol desaturase family protein n=1 Tax=Mucilaginibacter aurantiaciroseus TaxID=2949308 RepID=UPI0020906F54|nr:sterol desaturase family protein [Mucilaginibacter aurantiaciroseus]MCO5936664.1 sterol desaturase family protein [Mucilaginibacter aurantiaciroseus]